MQNSAALRLYFGFSHILYFSKTFVLICTESEKGKKINKTNL